MKLVLLLAAGALAAQDTTPPVISLTLAALPAGTAHRPDGVAVPAHAPIQDDTTVPAADSVRNANRHRSVTCEVGSTTEEIETTCPEPTCTAYDAHEGDVDCITKYILVNNDKTPQESDNVFDGIHRGLRSEWLMEYTAKDESNNYAETVSFTMIFQDTRTPTLHTQFGDSTWHTVGDNLGDARTDTFTVVSSKAAAAASTLQKSWAESCNEDESKPCEYVIPGAATDVNAEDKYDGDVTTAIQARLCHGSCGDGDAWHHPSETQYFKIDTQAIVLTGADQPVIEYRATDDAGMFGYKEQNNVGRQVISVSLTDNTAPIITIHTPAAPGITFKGDDLTQTITVECQRENTVLPATWYKPGGEGNTNFEASCFDARDSWVATQYVPKDACAQDADTDFDEATNGCVTAYQGPSANAADVAVIGQVLYDDSADALANEYVTTYQCQDMSDNAAAVLTRTIVVEDTTPPVINLKGPHFVENSAGLHKHDSTCADDEEGTADAHCRGTSFEDGSKPFGLNMADAGLGPSGGAVCTDTCEPSVTVTAQLYDGLNCDGDLVTGAGAAGALSNWDEFAVGDYSIKYTCKDGAHTSQNSASVCRKIKNVDHTRPVIQVLGADEMVLEATHEGNYVDDGATCSDQVDGVISRKIEVSGDVVNLSKEGTYTVYYDCRDAQGNTAPQLKRVVTVKQTTCPKCTMSGCESVTNCKEGAGRDCACSTTHEASFAYTDASAACSDNIDGGSLPVQVNNPVNIEHTGTYVVTYWAQNSAGRRSDMEATASDGCYGGRELYYRTVVVKDTLKPFMQISYNNKVVGYSAKGDRGDHDLANPAESHWDAAVVADESVSPHPDANDSYRSPLMAEAAAGSANAWALAGVAAAVAGVALLASGQRRVETSVPV